ncbi:MAG TPA: ATP-binding protein [Caulobacteraceae bacterium]|nr:ATP-binding protein [Caulobacteraceae bacterium]
MLGRIAAFTDSLTGRVMLILTVGVAAAAILALFVSEQAQVREFERIRLQGGLASTLDIAGRLERDPVGAARLLNEGVIFGALVPPATWRDPPPDLKLSHILMQRLGPQSAARVMLIPRESCLVTVNVAIRAAGMIGQSTPDCWYVRFRDSRGVDRRLIINLPLINFPPNSKLDPLYMLLIVCGSAVLAFPVARFATAPLGRLTAAARDFSVTVDPDAIPEHGPSEVRAALKTFNIMQSRVRDGFRERTQILSSISHDLQTPLTRLRLRLEQVSDEHLRNLLINDLVVMQKLVRDGLDLARSSESREPWSIVDIDSILSSAADDNMEFGNQVSFVGGCGAQARVKPNALVRCLNNLIDNAVKYAAGAELSCKFDGPNLLICVRDHGPGIPEHRIEEAFQPFSRLGGGAQAGPGTGLGLTIAQAQARTFGASLTLANHADGGVLAVIRINQGRRRARPRRPSQRRYSGGCAAGASSIDDPDQQQVSTGPK